MNDAINQLIDEWFAARAAIHATEKAEHPDVTDALGRVWVWSQGDLYRHDSMCWPLAATTNPNIGWPHRAVLDNPNYQWCETCKEGRS